jgi:hypothetical protein
MVFMVEIDKSSKNRTHGPESAPMGVNVTTAAASAGAANRGLGVPSRWSAMGTERAETATK